MSAFVLSIIDLCNSPIGSAHDVTSFLQRIQIDAVQIILRIPESSNITTHLKSLHWLLVNARSTCIIAYLCYQCDNDTAPSYVTDMLHGKLSYSRNTRSISHTMPLLNNLHTVRQHLVIARFLLPLLSGTLSNNVTCAHHSHLCLIWRHIYFLQSTDN